jgi:hypothetical protein
MKRFRLVLFILFASGYWLVPGQIHAQTGWNNECISQGDVATIKGIGCLIGYILTVAIQLLGLVFFLMLLFGGIKYLISGGDPKAVEAAKGTITSALTGLIIAILAWFILFFIEEFTGAPVTLFQWRLPEP